MNETSGVQCGKREAGGHKDQLAELARLQRDNDMLRHWNKELLTTDVGEVQTRNEELFRENQELRARFRRPAVEATYCSIEGKPNA